MNRYIKSCLVLCLIMSFIFIISCNIDSEKDNVNSKTNKTETLKSPKMDNSKEVEKAKEVVKKYFNALTKYGDSEKNNYLTKIDYQPGPNMEKIDSITIISIKEDKDGKIEKSYMENRGLVTKPYDVMCFEVTYNIQNNKEFEDKAIEPSGEKTTRVILIKESKSSTWLIDEMGY